MYIKGSNESLNAIEDDGLIVDNKLDMVFDDGLEETRNFLSSFNNQIQILSHSLQNENIISITKTLRKNDSFLNQIIFHLSHLERNPFFNKKKHVKEEYDQILISNKICTQSFIAVKNEGDGNCLFRAVSQNTLGTEEFHKILRILTVFVIIENFKFFLSISESKKDFFNYVENIAQNRSFAGEIEEMALSYIFKRSIINYSIFPTLEFFCINEKKRFLKEPILIIFDSLKLHFSSILKKEKNHEYEFSRPTHTVFDSRLG